jgi:two-component system phosphate regulon response regulator PhoB
MAAHNDKSHPALRRVLVAVEETEARALLRTNLEASGFRVAEAEDGVQAGLILTGETPDMLVLDWMLPEVSGVELLRRLRLSPSTEAMPVIVVSGQVDEADRVLAFDAGADDLVIKPFSVNELMARVEALLRRAAPAKSTRVVVAGDLEFDHDLMCVRRRGKTLQLGPTDFRLLEFFIKHPGRAHTREEIRDAVWGSDSRIDARTVDVHVGRLRKSLLEGWRTDPIKTIRRLGYRFDSK